VEQKQGGAKNIYENNIMLRKHKIIWRGVTLNVQSKKKQQKFV